MSTSSNPTHTHTSSVDVPSTPPEDSPKSSGFKLRIATFRDAVDTLNWNRNDLSGATTEEYKRMDVPGRLGKSIAAVQALIPQLHPRFAEDLRHALVSIERAQGTVDRWQWIHDQQAAAKE